MSLRRKLAVVAAVYVVEGFPMGVFGDLWPVYWVDAGLSDAAIGALSGLGLAWSAKALWSPLVGRWPAYRAWMAGALAVMTAALVTAAGIDPAAAPALMTAAVATFCLASATQDIAIDAYTIGLVARGEEGPANGVRITAYRAGALLSGAGLFFLPARIGWPATHLVAAALAMLLLAVPARVPSVTVAASGSHPSPLDALRRLLLRPGAAGALAFVLLFRLADFAAGPMMKPFFRRSGVSLEAIGIVSTGIGTASVLLGAALGGWLVTRLGIGRALAVTGVAALASNLGYAAAALAPDVHAGLYAASAVESFCTGLAIAAFMSFLMRICDREYAAVQYAVLTGLYALAGRGLGMTSGVAAEEFGYAAFFAATALLGLPGLALLPAATRWLEDR